MAGDAFINRLAADPAIRLLLMSYDLLAVDRRLLAEEALDTVRGHLHDHGIDVELSEVVGGAVYVKLHGRRAKRRRARGRPPRSGGGAQGGPGRLPGAGCRRPRDRAARELLQVGGPTRAAPRLPTRLHGIGGRARHAEGRGPRRARRSSSPTWRRLLRGRQPMRRHSRCRCTSARSRAPSSAVAGTAAATTYGPANGSTAPRAARRLPVAVEGDEVRVAVGVEPVSRPDRAHARRRVRQRPARRRRLRRRGDPSASGQRAPARGVELMEVGTAGIRLAQELLTPYDRLIIVDAMTRGGAPGTVYVWRWNPSSLLARSTSTWPSPPARSRWPRRSALCRADVFIVGCEPAEVDELTTELTPAVRAAVDTALSHIDRLLPAGGRAADPLDDAEPARRDLADHVLAPGEGFGPDVAAADILRFIDDEHACEPPSAARRGRLSRPSRDASELEPLPPDGAGRPRRPPPLPRRVRAVPGEARATASAARRIATAIGRRRLPELA